jgi:hypothetical protein
MEALSETKRNLISKDAETIRTALNEFPMFDYAGGLSTFMKIKGINVNELAKQLNLGVTIVDKWRFGDVPSRGREQMKEIGLALLLTERELNHYLLSVGHKPLCDRNPLDNACIYALRTHADGENPVAVYKKSVADFLHRDIKPAIRFDPGADTENRYNEIRSEDELDAWVEHYAEKFRDLSNTILPNKNLILFTTLFLGIQALNEMYETGELPGDIRLLLSSLLLGKEFAAKNIRDRLIAFGIQKNLTDIDIDRLMEMAKLRRFSSPETPFEAAVLMAVRQGHLRFPAYENDYLSDLTRLLGAILKKSSEKGASLTSSAIWRMSLFTILYEETSQRTGLAEKLNAFYFSPGQRGEEEHNFEKFYTAYSEDGEKSLAGYVKDIAALLKETGEINSKEADDFCGLFNQ